MDEATPSNTPGHIRPLEIAPRARNEPTINLPALLLPLKSFYNFRNLEFRDLSNEDLDNAVKVGICNILEKHSGKTYHNLVGDVGQSLRHLCRAYNLTIATINGR